MPWRASSSVRWSNCSSAEWSGMQVRIYHGNSEAQRKTGLQFAWWESVGGIVLPWLFKRDCARSSFWAHSAGRRNQGKRILGRLGGGFLAEKTTGETQNTSAAT